MAIPQTVLDAPAGSAVFEQDRHITAILKRAQNPKDATDNLVNQRPEIGHRRGSWNSSSTDLTISLVSIIWKGTASS